MVTKNQKPTRHAKKKKKKPKNKEKQNSEITPPLRKPLGRKPKEKEKSR